MPWLAGVGKLCLFLHGGLRKNANAYDSVLCGEMAVKLINEPFIKATDDKAEWAL